MADDQLPVQETANQRMLRGLIGETIPEGGDASESMVTAEQLDDWLSAASGNFNKAALMGWQYKLAHWANLVTVVDGAATRNFSDLMGHAQTMIGYYENLTEGTARKRARVGSIVRP